MGAPWTPCTARTETAPSRNMNTNRAPPNQTTCYEFFPIRPIAFGRSHPERVAIEVVGVEGNGRTQSDVGRQHELHHGQVTSGFEADVSV